MRGGDPRGSPTAAGTGCRPRGPRRCTSSARRLGGGGEHRVGDLARLGDQDAQAHAGEDEGVVALADRDRARPRRRPGRTGCRWRPARGRRSRRSRPRASPRTCWWGSTSGRSSGPLDVPRPSRGRSASVKVPGSPEVPISTVGLTARTTASRSRAPALPSPAFAASAAGQANVALVRVRDRLVVDQQAAAVEAGDGARSAPRPSRPARRQRRRAAGARCRCPPRRRPRITIRCSRERRSR